MVVSNQPELKRYFLRRKKKNKKLCNIQLYEFLFQRKIARENGRSMKSKEKNIVTNIININE